MTTQVYELGGYGVTRVLNLPILSPRDPVDNIDIVSPEGNPYDIMQAWRNTITGNVFQYTGNGNWMLSSSNVGPIDSLTADSGGAITPSAGNIDLLGTANQIATTGTPSTITFSLPTAITAPGSLTTTTFLAAGTTVTGGTGVTATTGNIVATAGQVNAGTSMTAGTDITATAGNISATAGSVSAGTTVTGGTGVVATTGNIVATAGQVNAGTTMTAGTGITSTTGDIVATAGAVSAGTTVTGGTGVTATTGDVVATAGQVNAGTSMTAGTTITATLGDIQATNGNLVLNTAGNKIVSTSVATTIAAGANSFGSVVLVGGTATVSTSAVTANSLIVTWRQSIGATGAAAIGNITVGTVTPNTSFDINSVSDADATALVASDVSVVGWMIIN